MLATTLAADPYLGRLLTGRIETGTVRDRPDAQGARPRRRRDRAVPRLEDPRLPRPRRARRSRPPRPATSSASPAWPRRPSPTPSPTSRSPRRCRRSRSTRRRSRVTFGINDSPLAGRDGDKVQSRVIRDRLLREAETNVAIRVSDTPGGDAFEVAGRGELQMGVLIENMRREGFELSVSAPARALPRGGRPAAGADRGGDRRRRRGVRRRRRRQAQPAQGRPRRDAHRRRRQDPDRRPRAAPRADRLPRRVPDRHPRHRRAQPGLPRLGAAQGRRSPAGATAC